MKTTHTRIAAHIPKSVAALLLHAAAIVKAMSGDPRFIGAAALLTKTTTDAAALQDAEARVHTTKGVAPARDTAAGVLVIDMHSLEHFVQGLADAAPAQAVEIIQASGFAVTVHVAHQKAPLTAEMGPGGVVVLRAHAGAHGSVYEFQMSLDGGKTYTSLPAMSHANTTVTGLAAGTSAMFRVRINKGDVVGDWSQPVTLLVH